MNVRKLEQPNISNKPTKTMVDKDFKHQGRGAQVGTIRGRADNGTQVI